MQACLQNYRISNPFRKHVFRYGQVRTGVLCRAKKEVWLMPESKEALRAGLEAGITTIVLSQDAAHSAEWTKLANFTDLTAHTVLDMCASSSTAAEASSSPVQPMSATCKPSAVIKDYAGSEVGRVYSVTCPADLHAMEAAAASGALSSGSAGDVVVIDTADWKVIPAENLVALLQPQASSNGGINGGVRLFGAVSNAEDASLMLGALQIGTAGVFLHTGSASEVCATVEAARSSDRSEDASLTLEPATVTRVTPVGMGDRVCVDLACMMTPGEGMLVGSFARGLFLVHSECEETQYINSRPFRVHGYVAGPKGRTSYLAEVRTGAGALVVSPQGRVREAVVGRSKLESRPLVMIEARDRDGGLHSVLLQNAETVKLVGTVAAAAPPTAHIDCGLVTHGSDSDSSSHLGVHSSQGSQEVGIDIVKGGRGWQTLSVASLQPGDSVLLHRPHTAARHMGIPIKEFIIEQ